MLRYDSDLDRADNLHHAVVLALIVDDLVKMEAMDMGVFRQVFEEGAVKAVALL
jgi:hypothetical protein